MTAVLLHPERLTGVHADLVRVVNRTLTHVPWGAIALLEGRRTIERQRLLLAQHATTTLKSRHLTGHAVDIAPVLDTDGDGDVEVTWAWPAYHKLAECVKQAAAEEQVSIEWGGDWKTFKDGPHWQLPWAKYP